jgi:phage tail-like protein
MAVQRERPYAGFNFLVDLGTGNTDGPQAGFEEVILPEFCIDVIEYRTGNEKENSPRKLTALEHYTNLVLKRGVIGSLDLYNWINQIRNGDQSCFRNVTVQLQNEDHTSVVLTWKFLRARPVKFSFGSLNAKSNDIAIEYVELAFERLEME